MSGEILASHLWTILAALLASLSTALLGSFLVLRRISLLGDAISHAILPGIALAFIMSGTRHPLPMFIGAAIFGLLTAFLSHFLNRHCSVDRGAALGVVFTTLFAFGIILLRQVADSVDLDPGCVLYGLLEFTPLDTIMVGSFEIPRAVAILSVFFLVNCIYVAFFYKELLVTSFDPALATTLGINAALVHYSLMGAVAATSVAAFESVGSILVIALFIVPTATARFFSDRLSGTITLSLLFAAIAAVLGYILAVYLNTSVAGAIGVICGLLFIIAAIFAPRYGITSKLVYLFRIRLKIVSEDILGVIYRSKEEGYSKSFPAARRNVVAALGGGLLPQLALSSLAWKGFLRKKSDNTYSLTTPGEEQARSIIRAHRLWETYLVDELELAPDHVHETATKLEHFTPKELEKTLLEATKNPTVDPHGKAIPKKEDETT